MRMGPGAIYANSQAREPVKRGQDVQRWRKFGGIPTLYVPKDQYQSKETKTDQESSDLQQIISRIENYNPEQEFVVVFEAGLDAHTRSGELCFNSLVLSSQLA